MGDAVMPAPSSRIVRAFAIVLVAAFAIRMFVAYAMPNIIWPDEIYQSLEQAHRLVFGNGIIPWEFRDGARSWMLPGFLAGIMKITSWFTSSSFAYLTACAGALATVSLMPVWAALRLGLREHGVRGAVVAGGVAVTWFELVYFAPKALSEVVGGNLLVLGVALGATLGEEPRRRRVIVTSAVLALAAMLRIQLAPAAFVPFVLVLRRLQRAQRWDAVLAGGAVVLVAGAIDWISWSYPFQSYVENVRVNVIEGKSARYGIAGWAAYFEVYARIWGLWLIPMLALAVLGARRAPMLGLSAVLALVVHVAIAHKEYRFAYPVMALVVVLAGLGSAACVAWVARRTAPRGATLAAGAVLVVWATASLRGANAFDGEKTQLATGGHEQLHWLRHRGGLLGLQHLGEASDLCGVGIVSLSWTDIGGYAWLHRDVPIFPFRNEHQALEGQVLVNGLITPALGPDVIGPFVRVACWDDACIYRRAGTCRTVPGYSVNQLLEKMGR
jgi:hypothetical protein